MERTPIYQELVEDAIPLQEPSVGHKKNKLQMLLINFVWLFGAEILKKIASWDSMEVDARLSFNKNAMLALPRASSRDTREARTSK